VQRGQAYLYDLNCNRVKTGTVSDQGATVTYSNVSAGTYIIGIKYNPGTVVGSNEPDPTTVTYTFTTKVNGADVGSLDTVDLKKKP
jgi:hypothetical protein